MVIACLYFCRKYWDAEILSVGNLKNFKPFFIIQKYKLKQQIILNLFLSYIFPRIPFISSILLKIGFFHILICHCKIIVGFTNILFSSINFCKLESELFFSCGIYIRRSFLSVILITIFDFNGRTGYYSK